MTKTHYHFNLVFVPVRFRYTGTEFSKQMGSLVFHLKKQKQKIEVKTKHNQYSKFLFTNV